MAAKPNGNRVLTTKEVIVLQKLVSEKYRDLKLQDDKFAEMVNRTSSENFLKPITHNNIKAVREALDIEGYYYRVPSSKKVASLQERFTKLETEFEALKAQVKRLIEQLGG